MENRIPPSVEKIVDLAIEEDFGRGDVTTRLTVASGDATVGRAVARADMIVSGGDVFALVMRKIDPDTQVELAIRDGYPAAGGALIAVARGRISSLLAAERVALNFLQRLSGVATLTRKFVDRLPSGAATRITDTRKTTPGMRFLERRAVLHGGGHNHRIDLAGGILIKENHIAAAGSVEEAVRRCVAGAPHPLRVEVEVRDEHELAKALDAGAEAVLLDNMTVEEIARCVAIARGRALIEVSGGVALDTVEAIAATGVDVISVGALTHSAPSADISFLLDGT